MSSTKTLWLLAALAVLGPGERAAAQGGALPPGDYTCNARRARGIGLPLGTMTLSGNEYRFSPPNGLPPVTSGRYRLDPDGGISWSGDIGAVKNAQIGESRVDAGARNSFWFEFELSPGADAMPVSCGR